MIAWGGGKRTDRFRSAGCGDKPSGVSSGVEVLLSYSTSQRLECLRLVSFGLAE